MSLEKMRAFIIKFLFFCIIIGVIYFLFTYLFPLITPFLVAFILSFLLQPSIRFVCKKTKAPQKVVSVLILIAFYCLFVTFSILVGSQIIVYANNLLLSLPLIYANQIEPTIATAISSVELFFSELNPNISDSLFFIDNNTITSSLSSLVSSFSSSAIGTATSIATSVPTLIFEALITIIASFFFVGDYDKIIAFILKILPESIRNTIIIAKSKGFDVLLQFGRAYAILLSITFIELIIGFSLLGVENAILFAFLTAIVDILPILGTGTILIPWGIIMLILGNFPFGIGILILYAIITVVRQSLEPRIIGHQIGLYPLITLICMFVGLHLFGFLGLLGIPVIVTLIVQLNKSGDLKWF